MVHLMMLMKTTWWLRRRSFDYSFVLVVKSLKIELEMAWLLSLLIDIQ